MNIGKAIKLCRTQKDMRQSELAVSADISIAYLYFNRTKEREIQTFLF